MVGKVFCFFADMLSLCRLAMPNDKESEDRIFAQLKVLDGGKPYRYMYSRLFPELRKAGVKVVAVCRYGYFRGRQTVEYVKEVTRVYERFKGK